jgi:hypothetical protein
MIVAVIAALSSNFSHSLYSLSRAGSRRGMASAHPTNGVVEDEGKS